MVEAEASKGLMMADFKYKIPADANIGKCKGRDCGEDVWWFYYTNKRGRRGMVCADTDGTPHHATCPNADDFRRKHS